MEYVYKSNIFGLKMMMKSDLEKIFLKFLHAQSLFQKVFFITEWIKKVLCMEEFQNDLF